MVLAIIGCVLAFIQLCIAADGAANVKRVYGVYFNYDDYVYGYCEPCVDVSHFVHSVRERQCVSLTRLMEINVKRKGRTFV